MSEQFVPERPVLDLNYTAFDHTVGNIRIVGTWETHGARDPCMALFRADRDVRHSDVMICIIRMENIWRWLMQAEQRQYQIAMCSQWIACGALPGSPSNKKDLWRVFDAINSRLEDFFQMPPAPLRNRSVAGEIIMTDRATGKVTEREIYDDV